MPGIRVQHRNPNRRVWSSSFAKAIESCVFDFELPLRLCAFARDRFFTAAGALRLDAKPKAFFSQKRKDAKVVQKQKEPCERGDEDER
jgi:hypothetical protein